MANTILSPSDFAQACKKGLSGAYLFFGEEEYLKHHYLQQCRDSIVTDASLAPLNHIRLEGEQASPQAVWDAMATPPIFAEQKLIEVHSVMWDRLSEDDAAQWENVFSQCRDYPEAVIVCYAELDEMNGGTQHSPSKALQSWANILTPVRFPLQTDLQLAKWIFRHFQAAQINASSEQCNAILSFCGKDMCTLSTELEKLIAYLKFNARNQLLDEDIPLVCCRQMEQDAFALTNAILDGATAQALAHFAEKKARREKPEMILGGIAHVCCDLAKIRTYLDNGLPLSEIASRMKILSSYRVSLYAKQASRHTPEQLERAVLLCAAADRKIKTASTDPYLILERLIVRLGQKKGGV